MNVLDSRIPNGDCISISVTVLKLFTYRVSIS